MKRLCALSAIILFLFLNIQAQPANTNTEEKAETPSSSDNTNTKNKKSNIPAEKAAPVKIPLTIDAPVIDGKLDEEMWKQAAVFKDFVQTSPGDRIAPSKETEVYVFYDEKNLYVGFKCWDDKDKIRATVAKRDNVTGEDNVRFWLDTYDDQRRAYIFAFNPFGIQQDGIYTEGRGTDFSVDIVMESKGVIQDWGWSVEVKIPFKSLRYAAGKGKFWGFNAARNIDRFNDELDEWMPIDPNITGRLIQHGKITGLNDIKFEKTLEIVPSVTISETGNRVRTIPRSDLGNPVINPSGIDPGRFVNEPVKPEFGANIKYTLTPNITLDAAINPDFAEIEADAPIVTANRRFPVFFQEKRPFFLEGADIFNSPLQIFYSRTIIDPDYAAKLTGKIGKNSFGFLVASDNAPGNYAEDEINDRLTRPRINEFIGKKATFAVLRAKRDFGAENNVGFFSTYRSFPEQKNVVGGFDGRFKLNDKTVSQFQVVGTHSRRCFFNPEFDPTLDPFQAQRNREICDTGRRNGNPFNEYRTGNGIGYTANVDNTEKNRGWFLGVSGRSADYRTDAGFTRRTNTNSVNFGGRISTEPNPSAKIIRINWRQNLNTSYDWNGRLQDFGVGTNVGFNFRRNTFLNFETGISLEKIYEDEFGLTRSAIRNGAFFGAPTRSAWQQYGSVNLNSSPKQWIAFGVFVGAINNAFDFDFGGGRLFPRVSLSALSGDGRLDPGPGLQFNFGGGVELKPSDPFSVSLEYNKSSLTRKDTDRTAFDSNIFTLRSTYQFTRFIFTRTRIDYSTLSRNASGQLLFGWNPSPGTSFYVGYNDNFNYGGFNPFSGQHEPRFERNSRTFFIRMSYLFRKSF